MKTLILISISFLSLSLFAQNKYNYSNLPEELKKNANYIIWEDFKQFEILDKGLAIEKVRLAVCIVDQYSKRFNTISANYRKNEKISNFKAEIYDKDGNSVKKLKSSELKDVSSVSSFSLFEDDRVIYADFIYGQYPYTLVYEYEKKVDGLLNYPSKYFQSMANTGVLSSQLNLIVPNDIQFKYKEFNLGQKVKISNLDKKKMYSWTENNIKPFDVLELAPPDKDYEPMLKLAPVQFAEGGYEGLMDTWENFGAWILKLNKDRDILPESRISELKLLVKDATDDREKARILYKYMQDKTRYVSVQLGIGGYQPFTAEYVDSKGYGDCKALSNYMYSLLKAVGINSEYALVLAGQGENDILTDFSSSQFNHVILCIPQLKDSIWLECTSQLQPFNFLGSFTDDRHSLLISENGGRLVKTPKYDKKINTQNRKAFLTINADGNAAGSVSTVFNGLQYENRDGWVNQTAKEQKDALKSAYPVGGLEINTMKFSENKDEIPNIKEQLDMNIFGLAAVTNKRMFIKLNIFNESTYVPKNEDRKVPFKLSYEYIDSDTIQLQIPDAYSIESMPQPLNLQTKFGGYEVKMVQEGNIITYIRKYSSEKGIYLAQDYSAYYEYRKQVVKTDKAKLVLVKKL